MPELAAFHRIVVAVADGRCADQLMAAAARLASVDDSEVLLVHVADCNACCGAMDHPALHEHERILLQSMVEGLCARGVRARSEMRSTTTGRIAQHLLDVTAEWQADLLIAPGGRSGLLRGRGWRRVMSKLLDDASCPVLLLPRGLSSLRSGNATQSTPLFHSR